MEHDTQRLTDADFEPVATTTAATDAGTNPENPGGYPDWGEADAASLSPDPAPALDAAVSAEPSLPDSPPDPDPDAIAADLETPEALADPADPQTPEQLAEAERISRLEQELAARDERIAQYEAQQRDLARVALDERAAWEEQQIDLRVNQEWQRVIAQADRLQGAARTSLLNARFAQLNQARDEQKHQIATIHQQGVIELLANDPTTQHNFLIQQLEEHQLPEEAYARLARVHPNDVDALIPELKAEYATRAADRNRIVQLERELEVQRRAATGADAMGGGHRSDARPDPRVDPTNPSYDPTLAYEGAGQWVRAR